MQGVVEPNWHVLTFIRPIGVKIPGSRTEHRWSCSYSKYPSGVE